MLRLGDGPFNSPTQFHFQPPMQGTGVLAGLGNVETTDFIVCLQCQVSFKDGSQDIMMSLLKIVGIEFWLLLSISSEEHTTKENEQISSASHSQ
jgi:hypothetical protein